MKHVKRFLLGLLGLGAMVSFAVAVEYLGLSGWFAAAILSGVVLAAAWLIGDMLLGAD